MNSRKEDKPNKETLDAFAELEEMKKHPENYKTYETVEALMKDLLEESAD